MCSVEDTEVNINSAQTKPEPRVATAQLVSNVVVQNINFSGNSANPNGFEINSCLNCTVTGVTSAKIALATRAEYMSDRGGLFSGITQSLKENTVTFDYKLADGLLMRYEWRRDFSNQRSFLTDVQGVFSKEQNTATVGLLWWWGRRKGHGKNGESPVLTLGRVFPRPRLQLL